MNITNYCLSLGLVQRLHGVMGNLSEVKMTSPYNGGSNQLIDSTSAGIIWSVVLIQSHDSMGIMLINHVRISRRISLNWNYARPVGEIREHNSLRSLSTNGIYYLISPGTSYYVDLDVMKERCPLYFNLVVLCIITSLTFSLRNIIFLIGC